MMLSRRMNKYNNNEELEKLAFSYVINKWMFTGILLLDVGIMSLQIVKHRLNIINIIACIIIIGMIIHNKRYLFKHLDELIEKNKQGCLNSSAVAITDGYLYLEWNRPIKLRR